MAPTPELQPPPCTDTLLSFPSQHILLVTLDRPGKANCYTRQMSWDLDALWRWFDNEPSLRVAVITGVGDKAFCGGSDLLEIRDMQASPDLQQRYVMPPTGSAGLSRRRGKKPVIAAVNGLALGGGFEIALNWLSDMFCGKSDLVIASPTASFGLPETLVGVYAWSGGLPRLVHTVGMQLASEITFTGRRVSATEALSLHLINKIAGSQASVLEETLEKAREIAAISSDGVIVSRAALREAWETASVERAFQITHERYYHDLLRSENCAEGLAAFKEKRKPVWKDSKL